MLLNLALTLVTTQGALGPAVGTAAAAVVVTDFGSLGCLVPDDPVEADEKSKLQYKSEPFQFNADQFSKLRSII